MRRVNRSAPPAPPQFRCAIYTRKSTDEGLDKEFNSLDAQRDSGEAYIRSQQHEGWTCLPQHYDDGGFTGGNMDRPALQRLLADIEAGKVDCVVVYKVDRLSRSLLDFAKMMEKFEKNRVSFVSVTQQFNTATSMGRLVLNVLLSFAQFEREIISERTRDKIAAARRKGKWSGGMPVLGYNVDPQTGKLVVNEDEAARVRAIFEMYLDHESLLPLVQELERRGWANKQWGMRLGRPRGGKPFVKTGLHKLLTNVTYLGKIRYKGQVYRGEHPAIVEADLWARVQKALKRNARGGAPTARNKFGALLKGLLHCVPCGCAMSPSHSTKGNKRYRYYVCSNAQKRGWATCPSKSLPAGEIERYVVDQLKGIGRAPELLEAVIERARGQADASLAELNAEQNRLRRDLNVWNREVQELVEEIGPSEEESPATARLADLQDRIRPAESRLLETEAAAAKLEYGRLDEQDVADALSTFDAVWDALNTREQIRVLQLLVERVDYDGTTGKVAVTFHPTGIRTLPIELAEEYCA